MATQTSLELFYVKDLDTDAVAKAYRFTVLDDDGNPTLDVDITEASFRIEDESRRRFIQDLGTGATWDRTTQELTFTIMNSDLSFIKDDVEYSYSVVVTMDGKTEIAASGPLVTKKVD